MVRLLFDRLRRNLEQESVMNETEKPNRNRPIMFVLLQTSVAGAVLDDNLDWLTSSPAWGSPLSLHQTRAGLLKHWSLYARDRARKWLDGPYARRDDPCSHAMLQEFRILIASLDREQYEEALAHWNKSCSAYECSVYFHVIEMEAKE